MTTINFTRIAAPIAAAAMALALASCAAERVAATADVPAALAPSPNATLVLVAAAKGVQIYQCREKSDTAGTWAWQLVAPEAELEDARGETIGQHFAGPSWQARDGSKIVGTVQARSDAPQAGAIPWLLLAAKAQGPDGAFSRVTQVQRINTSGGSAPASGCTRTADGTTLRVPYTADYYFWKPGALYSSY
jgi:hypothetical protein